MVNYNCLRCGYETHNKSYLKRHLLRKNLCNPKLKEIDRYELLLKHGFDEESKRYQKIPKNPHSHLQKNEDNMCGFCNKELSSYKNKWRHEKTCKKKKDIEINNHLMDEILKRLKVLEQENRELKDDNYELKKQIKNNTNINRGTINNANKQVNIINNFGSENIDYITSKIFQKLLSTHTQAIPKLLELKHFNPNHPENHNVKITNIHDKYAKIYKDKQWLTKNKKEVIDDMIDFGMADFDDFKDLTEEELTEKIQKNFRKIEEEYENKNKSLTEKVLIVAKNGTEKVNCNDIDV